MKKIILGIVLILICISGFGQLDITKRTVTLDSINGRTDNVNINAPLVVQDTGLVDLIKFHAGSEIVNFGDATEIAFMNGTGTDFAFSPNFVFDSTKKAFTAGYRIGLVGNGSFVLGGIDGFPSEASKQNCLALGFSSSATANNAKAFGDYSLASGIGSLSLGSHSTASGGNSLALGLYSTASFVNSLALGSYTTASAQESIAIGSNSTASALGAISLCSSSEATGNRTLAAGFSTISNDYSEVTTGLFNVAGTGSETEWIATDNLFTVGNGISDVSRSNAFQIKKNGNTDINGDLAVSGDMYLNGKLISNPYIIAFYTPEDSVMETSLTTVYSVVNAGFSPKFLITENNGFGFDADTLVFNQNVTDLRDSVICDVSAGSNTSTNSVNNTVWATLFIKSIGDADYREIKSLSKNTRTISSGIYYFGPAIINYPVWLKDGDKIQLRSKVSAGTTTSFTINADVYIREQ